MEQPLQVLVHPSRFPARTRAAYVESFRSRRMNHQFHYDTEKQAQRWLALHEAFSPARTDSDCLKTYERAFTAVSEIMREPVSVVSLGCGGGQKDETLLRALGPKATQYVPMDVSLPLVLTSALRCQALPSGRAVIDLAATDDLAGFLDAVSPKGNRLFAFFGMLPNFEPEEILPKLSAVMKTNDTLLVSANLAPGGDYEEGIRKIMPLYDNPLTRQWLATVLIDAGLEMDWNDIRFHMERGFRTLLRIEATYHFSKPQTLRLDGEEIHYSAGEPFRLFFSYRHTSALLRGLLGCYGIQVVDEWITSSGEEGIFLGRKIT
jgi:L-histidine N-alpha-methyltransferase